MKKRWMAMLMALALTACGAMAETSSYVADLDGDGADETLCWRTVALDEYDECVELTVQDGAKTGRYLSDRMYQSEVRVADVDGDGRGEIFLSGDEMSDDYYTICLRYDDGAFEQLRFADANRGESGDEPLMYGYGRVTAIDGNRVELTGSQDVLGTWFGSRAFALEGHCFAFADDGLWRFPMNEERWGSRAELRPLRAIPAVFVDDAGAETEGRIEAGEGFVITASDKVSVVWFKTEDGRTGRFAIEPSGDGWSLLVAGVPQDELFAELPFAD